MQRSSDSIAALASALAKAQAQLVNPEKTLTAVLRPSWAGERERTFRYAPLSSGLDIVRKILGEHEIATIQSTAIDQGSGLVNLTTTLAHASGEWIASVWPICPVAELATPQRMGAALTYARRYALFTLVGIAGEDDLDAPDLLSTASRSQAGSAEPRQPVANSWGIGRPSGSRTPGNGRLGGPTHRSAAILKAELSASLRERLVEQVIALGTRTAATKWAATALAAKNSLTADDAKALEEAFEQKLSEFAVSEAEESSLELRRHNRVEPTSSGSPQTARKRKRVRSGRIDKSVLSITAAKRHRNKEHLRYVAQQPCLVCGRKPCDPHHLRFTQPRALGNKVSDEFTVPLCRAHHRAAHKAGDEREWWQNAGVDPMSVAKRLWDDTRSQPVSVMCSGSDPKDASHTTIHP
jgi:hypothetical protein